MSYKVLTQCFCSWPLANVYALHVICGCSQERMCRIAFIFWHYELHESYFNAYSRPAIKKNVILLEWYKQEFKQGWFMLLLLTFYNEEANIPITRSQTRLLLPNKCISYRYDENFLLLWPIASDRKYTNCRHFNSHLVRSFGASFKGSRRKCRCEGLFIGQNRHRL